MANPTEIDKKAQKKAKELSQLTEESVLEVHYYDNGDYIALLGTKEDAHKIFDHYKDTDNGAKMGFSVNLDNWYVMFYEGDVVI